MPSALDSFNQFLASQGATPQEDKNIIPPNLIQDYNQTLIPQEQQLRVVPQQSIEETNNMLRPEQGTHRTSLGAAYTLDDLETDAEFQAKANRFLEENGWWWDKSIFEYLRDSEYSLSSAIARSMEMKNWSEESKEDYKYLRSKFDNASLGGFKQTMTMVKDLAVDFLLDPINLVAMAASPLYMGASVATKQGIKIATKQALSKKQKSKLTKSMLQDAKKWTGYTAIEGAAWAGAHDYFLQQGDTVIGLRDQVDAGQVAVTTALGSALGGILGGSIGLLTHTSPLLMSKMTLFANETKINKHVNTKGKDPNKQADDLLDDWDVEQTSRGIDDPDKTKKPTLKYFFSQEEKDQKELKKFLSPVQKIIAETIGKPTTQLMKAGKAFKGLGTHLSLFRYDWMRTIFDTTRRGMDRLSFGEMFTRLRGEWHTDLEKALVNIERTGKHKKFGYNAFWIKRLDDTQNDHLFYLLTTRSGKKFRDKGKAGELIMPYGKYKGSKISQETIIGANKLGKLLDGIQGEAARSGMLYGVKFDALLNKKAFLKNYFPHKLQSDFIEAGRETIVKINPETGEREIVVGFKDLLKTYGKTISYKDANGIDQTRVVPYAEPNINIAPSERATVINKFGEKVEGPLIEGLTVDEKAFNMANFRQQAKDQMSDRKSKYYTKNPTEDEIREVATDIKADRIIDDIVKMKDEPFADVFGMEQKLGEKLSTSGRTGFLKERVFRHIPEEDMYRFIDTDVEGVMNDYITNAALMIKREQVFGRNLVIYQERHLQPLMYEMEKGGVHPTERKEIARRLIKMYNKVAGVEIDTPFGKGKTRFVMDGLKVMQALAHLPFATLSSITEPLIMLTRVRSGDTPLAARDIGKALYKEGAKMSEKIKNGIKRQVGIKHKGTKDFGDEYWLEAYKVGLALEQSIYDRLEGLYGEMVDTRLQRITRGFFKTTLLTQWTAAVQLAAFTTGKRLILENTKKLATGRDAWGNKLSKGRIERLTDELNDLNVNEKKAIRAYNSSLDSNGEFDMTIFQYGRGKKQKLRAFYNNDYLNGANRFSREIILIPDITEANKPLWYSHPVGQIFAQFASYPTAFNNTILKRFANEIVKDVKGIPKGMMPVATPKIVATTSLMTGVAMLTNIARSQGHSLEKPTTQVLIDAVDRWGGLGPGQYGYRFWENAQYGGGPIGSVAKAGSGPLVQDILDTVLYRKGIAENIAGNVPFYGWLPWEAKQALRREGKAIDKTLHLPFTAAPKPKPPKKRSAAVYATGGRVTLDKLAIPDKDKMTGLPYHMQAGVVWQGKEKEEGRTGLAEGGEVTADEGDAEVYSLITKDLRKQAPIFKDDDEIDIYNEEEAKKYAKGITEPVYRTIRKDTWQQNLEDIRDAENIGVHLSTEMPSTSEEVVLKGYVRMVRPLNLSSMEVPLEGFNFVEEIQNNSELKNKIIDDSLLPNETAEEIVDDLLFYHDLKKEAIQGKEDLPYLDKILNIVSSHKIREALKDIGYDGIIYGESEPIDQQMEELGLREEFFAGGLARLASKWAKEFFSKKYVGGGQYQKFINDLKKQGKTQEEINAISLEIRNDHLKILKEDIPQFKDVEISKDGSTLNLSKEQLEYLKKKEPTIDRVMVGNHGIYLEFAEPKNKGKKVKARQQYVEWNRNGNKLYQQTKTVNYANYSPGKWYGDIYDYLHPKKIKPKKKVKSKKAISFDSNQVKPVNKQLPLIGSTQRQTIKDNPKTLYVFADSQNKGVGVGKDLKGSSAADARGLPNTVGIVLQRNSSGKNRYWNDYKKDFKGRKTFNGQAVKRHHQQMNEGIEDVMRKVVLEGYDDVVYMSDLGTALEIGQTRFTKDGWDTKFNNLKRYTSDFKKFQGFKDEIGMDRSFGTISREKHLERDIAQVYGPAWKPTETIFKKEPVSGKVIGTAVEPITVMPKGTRDVRSSTLGSNTVMDKPRGSTATDVNVPPSEEYYSKGYKGELEALDKRDPIPTDFKEYKKYVKKLQESDSPYEQELAEELQIEWMKENPGEPFPDDWLPKIIKKKKSTGGIVRKKLAARLQ